MAKLCCELNKPERVEVEEKEHGRVPRVLTVRVCTEGGGHESKRSHLHSDAVPIALVRTWRLGRVGNRRILNEQDKMLFEYAEEILHNLGRALAAQIICSLLDCCLS